MMKTVKNTGNNFATTKCESKNTNVQCLLLTVKTWPRVYVKQSSLIASYDGASASGGIEHNSALALMSSLCLPKVIKILFPESFNTKKTTAKLTCPYPPPTNTRLYLH